jgi:hypothetical protein
MTGGGSPAWGLGKVLTTPQCTKWPCYKINTIATGLDCTRLRVQPKQ